MKEVYIEGKVVQIATRERLPDRDILEELISLDRIQKIEKESQISAIVNGIHKSLKDELSGLEVAIMQKVIRHVSEQLK